MTNRRLHLRACFYSSRRPKDCRHAPTHLAWACFHGFLRPLARRHAPICLTWAYFHGFAGHCTRRAITRSSESQRRLKRQFNFFLRIKSRWGLEGLDWVHEPYNYHIFQLYTLCPVRSFRKSECFTYPQYKTTLNAFQRFFCFFFPCNH